jgi:alpha-L-fucosidase
MQKITYRGRSTKRYFIIYSIVILSLFIGNNMNLYSQSLKDYKVVLVKDTTIFPMGTFKACHASTIVELSPGKFLASWFAGSYEGAKDVAIWTSVLENGNWSLPVKVASGSDSLGDPMPCWNPVLYKTKRNTLLLFYKVGPNPREWWGMLIKSFDNGKNWTKPQMLPEGFLGPIKNKPLQLSNGNILCPSSVESMDAKKWTIHLEITDEDISSWKKVSIQADSMVGVIQPSILQHPDGKLQLLCRSRQNVIYQTWSTDDGQSWSKLDSTSVPNPNSGIDAARLDNGNFVLVYNPLLQGKDWFYGRNVLNVAVSNDGMNWRDVYQLENQKEGEFSYPAVIQASDGTIHITYTYNRKNIKYVVLKGN